MIFKIKSTDKTEWAQAKDILHLLKSYEKEYSDFQEIQSVDEISEDEAKIIMLSNEDFNEDEPEDDENVKEFSLYDSVCGDDFVIVGSSDWGF